MKSDLLEEFRLQIHNRASEIDPDNTQDWYSLTLGWALAKGLPPEKAHEFASDTRYKTDLG